MKFENMMAYTILVILVSSLLFHIIIYYNSDAIFWRQYCNDYAEGFLEYQGLYYECHSNTGLYVGCMCNNTFHPINISGY